MSHTALARKYRPLRFADVANQGHVSETLRRAVASDRVGHAYLFCGPRGVGKTTLARVLAMALNCPARTEEGEPCGSCQSCERIWGGQTSLDVVEIDAASNRGVDDARDLRERAMYAPSEAGRFKVYILDEAHMLTREAWNALLKILEEPPPRVIFVFATTEPQKIQQTASPILSRCQRFDFRRIGVADIVHRLEEVLKREGTPGSEDALRIIARKADGGMRDALSLLDQVMALSPGGVDADSVRQVLGLVEEERYLQLLDLLAEGDARRAEIFAFTRGLLEEGYDLVEFYHGLVETLRILLELRLDPSATADVSEGHLEEFRRRAAGYHPADLVRMLAMAAEIETTGTLRRSSQPRVVLELLLLRFSYLDRTVEIEELIRALGGAPPARAGGPGGGSTASPPHRAERATAQAGPGGRKDTSAGARPTSHEGDEALPLPSHSGRDSTAPTSASPGAGAAIGDSPAAVPGVTSAGEAWERLLQGRHALPAGLLPFLRAASVAEERPDVVRVRVPQGPGLEKLRDPGARRAVTEALQRELGRRIELEVDATSAAPGEGSRITREAIRRARLDELIAREPLLGRAVEELDLELME